MLVLNRRAGEKILIGSDIVITIVRIGEDRVRIGVDADPKVPIVRMELLNTDGSREGHGSARLNQEEQA